MKKDRKQSDKGRKCQQPSYSFHVIQRLMGDTGSRQFLKEKAENRYKAKGDAR